ncbi:MAG TPA: ATP-binding protein [Bacillota bacterium]|nr:ATP-binding protein [Bacillota bacterium]
MSRQRRSLVSGPLAYAGAVVGPAVLTFGLLAVRPAINPTEVALAYLLLILAVASLTAFGPAVIACLAATFLFNYNFLPPYDTLTIADAANWFALFTFLTTAAVTSRFVTTVRLRSAEASARAAEALRLHELGRSLLTVTRPEDARRQMLAAATGILAADAVAYALWAGDVPCCEPEEALPAGVRRLLPAAEPPGIVRVPAGRGALVLAPLRGSRPPQAIAAYYEDPGRVPAEETLAALASLTTLALERVRLLGEAMEAEVVKKSEALKSALLSSVSHDVRTPLSAARIAATALQDPAVWNDADMRAELLATLDESTASLNRAVGNLLFMSRIEAGEVNLARRPCSASEIVAAAIEVVGPRRLGERLQVEIAPDLPPVAGDAGLLGTAVANLLDNALKYSPPGSPVKLRAEPAGGSVRIAVCDRGPGIPSGEESAVFAAFRRGARRPRAGADDGGVGLGLSIVRGLVEAHGGTAAILPRPGGGSIATLTLPALSRAAAQPNEVGARG